MAFRDMQFEMKAWIAKLELPFAQTIVNESLREIYEESLWSFQLLEGGFLLPGLLGGVGNSPGTVTLTQGSNLVTGDATAAAAWTAATQAKLIQWQFRSPAYALYNIVAFAGNQLTLDRPWMEPPQGAGQRYMIYQAYVPAPVQDFKRFLAVQDFQNAIDCDLDGTEEEVNARDPQRQVFANSYRVVPFMTDKRAGSATLGYPLFEMWPHNLAITPYHTYYARMGPSLVTPTDAVPWPLTDDIVKLKGRVKAYEYKASQVGENTKRGSGANWQFLLEQAEERYRIRLQQIRKLDRDLVDSFITKIRRSARTEGDGFYSAISGRASVGTF